MKSYYRVTNNLPINHQYQGVVGYALREWEDSRGDWVELQVTDSRFRGSKVFRRLELDREEVSDGNSKPKKANHKRNH